MPKSVRAAKTRGRPAPRLSEAQWKASEPAIREVVREILREMLPHYLPRFRAALSELWPPKRRRAR